MKITLAQLGISESQAIELLDHLEIMQSVVISALTDAPLIELTRDQVLTTFRSAPAQLTSIQKTYQQSH